MAFTHTHTPQFSTTVSAETALQELRTFTPADEECAFTQNDLVTFIQDHPVDFAGRRNWTGHVVAGSIVLSPDKTHVALVRRQRPKAWGYLDGHLEFSDTSLFEGARRDALDKLSLGEDDLTPLATRPMYLHFDPVAGRGQQSPHPHYVVSFLFHAQRDAISPRHAYETVHWARPVEIANLLGPHHPAAGLTRILQDKLEGGS